ncbi:transcriptional repressor LexA, partial [Salmonella enterica subsp. enterica serovar Montevideo]|nr:transcriptional repressor LexA [Salmonella enterica subsp. enterica serovar Montevideo]
MKALTARQQEVFDLIRDHISQTGMPPTRAEIAQRLGFRSPNAAEEHLKALARKGVLEIVSGASRGIRLLQEEEDGLPLVGRVAAGEPLLAQQHIEGHYQVDPFENAAFLLRLVQNGAQAGSGALCFGLCQFIKHGVVAFHRDVF